MGGYVISVVAVGAIGALVTLLSPEGELGKQVKVAVGIVLISMSISPLISMIRGLKGLDISSLVPEYEEEKAEYESIFYEGYLAAEEKNAEEGIIAMLCERFGIDYSDISVSLRIVGESGSRRIERIFITLYGSAVWKDTEEIERYLEGILGCEVITAIG